MSDSALQQKQSIPNQSGPVPQWKRPAVVPQPIHSTSSKIKSRKSILQRSVPWQMTVGAILLILSFLFSFFT